MPLELNDDFRPPRWLRNPHLQSILPTLPVRRAAVQRRAAPVIAASRNLILECGAGVRLLALHASPAGAAAGRGARAALLLHGWEGDANALYMLSLAQQLLERGFEVLRLNLRDHGGTQHLNRELFHSCRLAEVVGAVRQAQKLFAGAPLHLAGFSLGGNFLLRVAARAQQEQLQLAQVVAVSPVLEPAATLTAIERSPAVYQRYFIRKWTASLIAKQRAWPGDYDFRELRRLTTLRVMTAELVRRFTSFGSLREYLDGYAITGARLAGLSVPATIITSMDDPIVPGADLQQLQAPPALRVIATHHGGHCGFLERLSGGSWAEQALVAQLAGFDAQS